MSGSVLSSGTGFNNEENSQKGSPMPRGSKKTNGKKMGGKKIGGKKTGGRGKRMR
tara:strand:- start:509 stop:673 length:165 start_codon:yes stop_codon:yes gene_type:complete